MKVKILAALLVVLFAIVGLLIKHNRTIEIDRQAQQKVEHMVQPPHRYLVP
jgi:hypothetical protein